MKDDQVNQNLGKQEKIPSQGQKAEIPKTPEQIAESSLKMGKDLTEFAKSRCDKGVKMVEEYIGSEPADIAGAKEIAKKAENKINKAGNNFGEKMQTREAKCDPNGNEPPPLPEEEWDPNGNEPPPLPGEHHPENNIITMRKEWEKKKETENKLEEEKEKQQLEFKKIDSNLFRISMGEENFKKYIEQQKNLSPEALVHFYHGLNSGGYKSALEIINSSAHGIKQGSGPTVSLVPVGQFWKGVGFRYSIRRDQIEFPGENNPNAVIRMSNAENMQDSGFIITKSGELPLDQFDAEIMRSQFSDPDIAAQKEILDKMEYFAEIRKDMIEKENKLKEKTTESQKLTEEIVLETVVKPIRDLGFLARDDEITDEEVKKK